MPKTQAQWIKVLKHDGWRQEAGGNHQVKMTKTGRRPITLPDNHRRAYSKGFEAQLRRESRVDGRVYSHGLEAQHPREAGLDR
ncbi:MAG TPA: hypothetical protein VHV75_03200 [Solirubrobacteraceae bacterium]|nr:hypothetical protein [Solirubrobacteraceae bacterium]